LFFNIRFLLDPLAAMTAETVEMEGKPGNDLAPAMTR
jgi:hypothetical protein